MLAIVASAIDRRTAVVGCDQTDHIMLNQRRVEMMRASGAHLRRSPRGSFANKEGTMSTPAKTRREQPPEYTRAAAE
jgi:hypothetical protein